MLKIGWCGGGLDRVRVTPHLRGMDDENRQQNPGLAPPSAAALRVQREAQALRDNLRRRKEQARARALGAVAQDGVSPCPATARSELPD